MKYWFFITCFLALTCNSFSQIPTTCFEIESILVNACGSPENGNEMVRFKVGSTALDCNNLSITWPNNPWRGLIQNATTAANIATLNNTIQGCGHLLEPNALILPSASNVLLITSHNMNVAANSFTNLNDTIYVIFQNYPIPTSMGHFANSPTTNPDRTLVMNFSVPAGCTDTVTYQPALLVGGDGARTDFTWSGVPTYLNDGCQAPFDPGSLSISNVLINNTPSTTICPSDSIALFTTITGAFQTITWLGGEGSFTYPNAMDAVYSSSPNDTIPFYIYCGITGVCSDTLWDTVLIDLVPPSIKSISPITADLCPGDSVTITASGGTIGYLWSTSAITSAITVHTSGQYWVEIDDGCYQDTLIASVTNNGTPPTISVLGVSDFCEGENVIINTLGNGNIIWSDNSTGSSLTIGAPGNYYVAASNSCGTDTAFFSVNEILINASFSTSDTIGEAPLSVNFINTSSSPSFFYSSWDYGNGAGSAASNPSTLYTSPGVYLVQLIVSESGCSDTAYQEIIVVAPDNPTPTIPIAVEIPTIFTPNGDNTNDIFKVGDLSVENISGSIYNRWGQELYASSAKVFSWDGKDNPEGTYFYVLEVTFINGEVAPFYGTVQLMK